MTPRAWNVACAQALPPRAAEALLLARQFDRDRDCDAAAAWLMATDRPDAAPAALARALRAQARRDRRAGGAHGPAWFASPSEWCDAFGQQGGDDPAELVAACQTLALRPGVVAAFAEREPASDTKVLAERDGCTRRRVQQCLAYRRGLEGQGQGVLL
ncbi:hypothetical protein [Thiomonas intermedia]|uniref:hypothetical protein n=1 Tax=Thiomonas intermedia TaxID=926 RepID=UPI0009A4E705|nr:hypothetical protein [Thiomonas intermedia]